MFRHGGDVNPDAFRGVIEELKRKELPMNNYRKNSGKGKSQCFGYVRQRNGTYTGSRLNFERPELYQELLYLAAKILPPTFPWLSIQVNINYMTEPHLDKGNRGESAIVAFGDFTGGELVINSTPYNSRNDSEIDIRHKIVYFDGSQLLHYTRPFTGTRYSVVFHTPDRDFLEIPKFSFVIGDDDRLNLREDLSGVTRIYRRDGLCVFSSDGVIPPRQHRKPTLRACIENVRMVIDELAP